VPGAIALGHHHPAHEREHLLAALVRAARADVDHAGVAARHLPQADDLAVRDQGVAGIHRPHEPHVGVAEVRGRVVRHVGDGRAEHDVEHEQLRDELTLEPERARELGRRSERAAIARQCHVRGDVATVERARHRVHDALPDSKILEKPTGRDLRDSAHLDRATLARAPRPSYSDSKKL
jgi:hypothetical protein